MPMGNLNVVTVTGKFVLLNGQAAKGSITFKSSTVLIDSAAHQVVMPVDLTATLDISGAFSVQIPATDDPDITPSGFTYIVTENITGSVGRTYNIAVPYNTIGSLDLSTIAPVAPSSGVSVYALQSVFNAHVADATAHLPAQSGHAGQYLTTDGTDASWGGSASLETYATQINGGSSVTLNLSGAQTVFPVQLTAASCAVSFSNVATYRSWTVKFKQDSTGNRAVTIPGATLIGGTSVTLDTAANAPTFISFVKDADGTYAFVGGSTTSLPAATTTVSATRGTLWVVAAPPPVGTTPVSATRLTTWRALSRSTGTRTSTWNVLSGAPVQFIGERNSRSDTIISGDTGGTYQLQQVAHASTSQLSLNFHGWYTPGAGADTTMPNSYTIGECYVVTGTGTTKTLTPVSFGGSASAVVAPDAEVTGTATVSITAGQTYWIRTYLTPAAGGVYPRLGTGTAIYPDELHTAGSNVANDTRGDFTTFLTSFGDVCGPNLTTGQVIGTHGAVAIVGDGIGWGTGDDFANYFRVGFIYRQLATNRAFYRQTNPNDSLTNWVTSWAAKRRPIAGLYADHAICQLGGVDVASGGALAAVQSAAIAVWQSIKTNNSTIKTWQTTLTPRSASTDAWATTGNQTADATTSVRVAFNNWLRGGAPMSGGVAVAVGTGGALLAGQAGHPLAGFFEIADLAESARDSGLWKAGYTDDGVNPNVTGHAAMAPGIVLSSLPIA